MPRPPLQPNALRRRRDFGTRLRGLRLAAGLSQEATAQAAGMERSFYAKLEAGQHSVLVDRVWDLADALSVEPSELFSPEAKPD